MNNEDRLTILTAARTFGFDYAKDGKLTCTLDQLVEFSANVAAAPPASPLRGREIPDGATHMRRPEYLTAWLFDGVATMPLWLIERYHSLPLPGHRKGCYALAVDGEFWRWMDVDRFNELYVSASAPKQQAHYERIANELDN